MSHDYLRLLDSLSFLYQKAMSINLSPYATIAKYICSGFLTKVFLHTYPSPYCAIRQSDAWFQGGGFPETTIMLAVFYQVQKDFDRIWWIYSFTYHYIHLPIIIFIYLSLCFEKKRLFNLYVYEIRKASKVCKLNVSICPLFILDDS